MRRFPLALALALLLPACQPKATANPIETVGPVEVTPPPKDPQLVGLTAAPDRGALAADTAAHLTVRVRITAEAAKGLARPPLALVLVVDTSGSMAGDAIANARDAATAMVDELEPGDRISIVTFDSRAELLVPPTAIDAKSSKHDIHARIDRMQARGTTDMTAGLQTALAQIGSPSADVIQRVVLLSDGVPNDATAIPGLAAAARSRGTAITALGLGLEYDETLLGEIARTSGGSFRRIEEGDQIAQAFVDEVFRVQRVVASNVVLALQPGPGVRIERVLGQPVEPAGGTRSIVLGELSENQHQDVFVELTVAGHRDGASVELLDASVGFDERTVGAGRLERRSFVGVRATSDDEVLANARDLTVEREAARARLASATLEAIALARGGDFVRARDLLENSERDARAHGKDDPQLREQLDEIVKLRTTFAAEAKAQAAAQRELSRGAPGKPDKSPSPMPVSGEGALSVKRSHADALGVVQPQSAPGSR